MDQRGERASEDQLRFPAHHRHERRPTTFVGHVYQIDPGHVIEQFSGEVSPLTIADRGKIELARLRLGERD